MFEKNKVYLNVNGIEKLVNKENELPSGLKLVIRGENNIVKLGSDCRFNGAIISVTNNFSNIKIGDKCVFNNIVLDINSGEKQSLEIGKGTTFFGGRVVLRDNSKIKIGENCLFADALKMWATDGHTVFDLETKEVVNNTPELLMIGNHCWIGGGVTILKNGSLPDETVVSAESVVTKTFIETNTVIGGNPAKILKRGIGWDRSTILNYKKNLKK